MAKWHPDRDRGAFGIRWFWHAVFGMGFVTALVLGICVFLNTHYLEEVAVAEGAGYAPPPLTAISAAAFIGDSYTAGAGATGPMQKFAYIVATHEGWTFQNFAHGGTGYIESPSNPEQACALSYCPPYPKVIPNVADYLPSIVIVSGGRNDVNQARSALAVAIPAFYRKLREAAPGARIVALSPVWDSTTPPAELAVIQADVKAAVTAVDGTYVDIGEPLSGHSEWIISDHVHPNDQGHAAIAAAVEKALAVHGIKPPPSAE